MFARARRLGQAALKMTCNAAPLSYVSTGPPFASPGDDQEVRIEVQVEGSRPVFRPGRKNGFRHLRRDGRAPPGLWVEQG